MSYCRRSPDSDVHMITVKTGIICHDCSMYSGLDPHFNTQRGALEHLRKHIKCGYKVPQYVVNRLNREIFNLV